MIEKKVFGAKEPHPVGTLFEDGSGILGLIQICLQCHRVIIQGDRGQIAHLGQARLLIFVHPNELTVFKEDLIGRVLNDHAIVAVQKNKIIFAQLLADIV